MTPLTELTLETAPKALWREFLGGYFDGGPHDVGAHPGVFFPRATLAFGQGPVEQPLTAEDRGGGALASAEIRVVCLPRRETVTANSNVLDGLGLLATDYVTFQFQIRAQRPRGPDAQLLADTVVRLVASFSLGRVAALFRVGESGRGHSLWVVSSGYIAAGCRVALDHCGWGRGVGWRLGYCPGAF